jgi:diguanylate cyclase (GGDEF)-like protein
MAQSPPRLLRMPGTVLQRLSHLWTRRSLRQLSLAERHLLTEAQVAATRPIVSGIIASGAVILAVTGMFEGVGLAQGLGYPWWVVELGAAAVAGCALAIWHIQPWLPRLWLTLLGTVLVGVFLSVPVPGVTAALAVRTGLFQLLPIALLAVLARPASLVAMVVTVLALAVLRVLLHGVPSAGAALYWLYTFTALGFGLLLSGYCTDFAVATFRIRQRLHRQASTDALTGLLNRSGWNAQVTEVYAAAVSRGQPLSFAFLDVDHFKGVNDTYGHEAGDRVLQILGTTIRQRQGELSHCARLGGEEFVVLMVAQPPEAVEGFVQRVRAEFAQAAREYGVTVSAGIAHRQPAEGMGQHLRRADQALYEAKAAGRDRLVVSRA